MIYLHNIIWFQGRKSQQFLMNWHRVRCFNVLSLRIKVNRNFLWEKLKTWAHQITCTSNLWIKLLCWFQIHQAKGIFLFPNHQSLSQDHHAITKVLLYAAGWYVVFDYSCNLCFYCTKVWKFVNYSLNHLLKQIYSY